MPAVKKLKIGILTVSDRASRGIYEDLSGKAIEKFFQKSVKSPFQTFAHIIPDEISTIKSRINELVDKKDCHWVITTGGTGPGKRDVTPEATQAVCEKILPGFGEIMRLNSFANVPTSILSRQIAGIRKKTLIVNLPGNPKAIQQCLRLVFPAMVDCLKVIQGISIQTNSQLVSAH